MKLLSACSVLRRGENLSYSDEVFCIKFCEYAGIVANLALAVGLISNLFVRKEYLRFLDGIYCTWKCVGVAQNDEKY